MADLGGGGAGEFGCAGGRGLAEGFGDAADNSFGFLGGGRRFGRLDEDVFLADGRREAREGFDVDWRLQGGWRADPGMDGG